VSNGKSKFIRLGEQLGLGSNLFLVGSTRDYSPSRIFYEDKGFKQTAGGEKNGRQVFPADLHYAR
jgi:hypothetical protein